MEALSLGVPVISTKWQAIPEIITNKKEGLLIQPKDSKELYSAINSINGKNYFEYSKNAYNKFIHFEENRVYKKLIENIVG